MPIVFLDLPSARLVHRNQIDLYGGDPGILNEGLLQSALAMPQATFGGEWLHEFPHGMAAAYLFHVVANHPFSDGNKRAGLAIALTFLHLNGFELNATETEVYELVLAVARGEADKSGVTEFIRRHIAS
jgi:death-on-curing protein